MIDELNQSRTGWARFSDDKTKRYRLARALTPIGRDRLSDFSMRGCNRVVFVMLNPSTADAFKLDPTVSRCVEFAQRWGGDILEVVNLYALRSSDPRDLYIADWSQRGADDANTDGIIAACTAAMRVIAAWGNHGDAPRLGPMGPVVRSMLERSGVPLYVLGTTNGGAPIHPFARGKHKVPIDREPVRWVPWRNCA